MARMLGFMVFIGRFLGIVGILYCMILSGVVDKGWVRRVAEGDFFTNKCRVEALKQS